MMFCSAPGQTYFISLFSAEIRSDLELSHGEFGAIYSIATLCSAFMLLRTGSLIDRIAPHKFALFAITLLAGAAVFLANSGNIAMLFIACFLLRQLGQGLTSMTASTTMVRYLPANKGKANALSNMGYSVSEAIMPTVLLFLIAAVSWRTSWMIIGLGLLIIMPCLSMLLRSSSTYQNARRQFTHDAKTSTHGFNARQWTRKEVIKDPFFYLFIPGLMSNSMLYTGFMFHQIHLVESKNWSLSLWGSLYAVFAITTIFTTLNVGNLADRVGAVRLAPWVTLPVGVGLLLLSSSDAHWIGAAFMILMAISTGAQGALSAPYFSERYGNKHFASIKSLGAFTMIIMTASSPVILGWFIDSGTSINRLASAAGVYALCATMLTFCAYCVLKRQQALT